MPELFFKLLLGRKQTYSIGTWRALLNHILCGFLLSPGDEAPRPCVIQCLSVGSSWEACHHRPIGGFCGWDWPSLWKVGWQWTQTHRRGQCEAGHLRTVYGLSRSKYLSPLWDSTKSTALSKPIQIAWLTQWFRGGIWEVWWTHLLSFRSLPCLPYLEPGLSQLLPYSKGEQVRYSVCYLNQHSGFLFKFNFLLRKDVCEQKCVTVNTEVK